VTSIEVIDTTTYDTSRVVRIGGIRLCRLDGPANAGAAGRSGSAPARALGPERTAQAICGAAGGAERVELAQRHEGDGAP
jgi:hypothetical protein